MPTIVKPVSVNRSAVAVIVPTYNAEKDWSRLAAGLRLQALTSSQVLIVDSSSEDSTRALAAAEGFQVVTINRSDFNHGGTRQLALQSVPWATIVVYLTQDAVLAKPDSLDKLIAVFADSTVAAAYGRQLPRIGAGPIEAHARLFNYPRRSEIRDMESRHALGIKAAFLSNSFSGYRVQALCEVGGFPSDVILAEDFLVAGRLLLAGWRTAYVAEAQVYHSHPFTITQEFRHYFDVGVCLRREAWLKESFGEARGEGKRFILSEFSYLATCAPRLIPLALLKTLSKALAYQLGLHETALGKHWSRKLSFHKGFWDK